MLSYTECLVFYIIFVNSVFHALCANVIYGCPYPRSIRLVEVVIVLVLVLVVGDGVL